MHSENTNAPLQSLLLVHQILSGLTSRSPEDVANSLTEHDFYRPDHRQIFRAIRQLCEQDLPIDMAALTVWIESNEKIFLGDDGTHLAESARSLPGKTGLRLAGLIREKTARNQLINVCAEIVSDVLQSAGHEKIGNPDVS